MPNIPIKVILANPPQLLNNENCFGFWDWFCKESSLENKANKLFKKFLRISKSPKINPDTMYLWFKNNCPVNGNLYDDFRISDIATRDVIYTVVPSSGHKCDNHRAELWGKENNFKEPIIIGTFKDIVNWFNN